MTIFQGVILNGTEVINAPTIVGDTAFQTNNQTITFGQPLAAASTRLSQDTTRAQMVLGLGTGLGNQLVIGENAWIGHDYDHAAPANPTLFMHSTTDPDVDNTQWFSVVAETTRSLLTSNHGALVLYAIGNPVVASSNLYSEVSLSIYAGSYTTTNTYCIITGYTDDGLHIAMGIGANTSNYNFILTTQGNSAKDHDHTPASTNPTLIVHSATDPDVNNTQWVAMTHNQTRPILSSGKGAIGIGTGAALTTMAESVNSLIVSGNIETSTYYGQYVQLAQDGFMMVGPGFLLPSRTSAFHGGSSLGQCCIAVSPDASPFGHGNQLIIASSLNVLNNKDFDHVTPANTTVFLHSNTDPDVDNTQWLSLVHNTTSATIATGNGDLILDPITEITDLCGVGLKTKQYNATLNDDATVSLPAGTGWGTFMIGDNQEYARIRWTSAAVVTLDEGTANVALADTDGFFCLYDGGATVTVKNRLGANLTLRYSITYS